MVRWGERGSLIGLASRPSASSGQAFRGNDVARGGDPDQKHRDRFSHRHTRYSAGTLFPRYKGRRGDQRSPGWAAGPTSSQTTAATTRGRHLDVITSKRHNTRMKATHKRATVYFGADLHRALKVKAAGTERSLSEIVNDAVKQSLAEDAEDLAAFEERAKEPNLAFEDVLKDLRRRGKL